MNEKKVREAIELIKSKIRILEKLENYGSAIEEKKKKHIGLYNTAIEALEKQFAMKVDFKEDVTEDMCVKCPSCGSFLGYQIDCLDENYQLNYCQHCGQKLDWSE